MIVSGDVYGVLILCIVLVIGMVVCYLFIDIVG